MLRAVGSLYSEDLHIFVELLNRVIPCTETCTLVVQGINAITPNQDIKAEYNGMGITLSVPTSYTDTQLEIACKELAKAYYQHLWKYHYRMIEQQLDIRLPEQYANATWELFIVSTGRDKDENKSN